MKQIKSAHFLQSRWAALVGVSLLGIWSMASFGAPLAYGSSPTYVLRATGTALQLNLGDLTLVAATSSASVGQSQLPSGAGTGVLTPLLVASKSATAEGRGTSNNQAHSCAASTDAVPASLQGLLSVGLACSGASGVYGLTGMQSASGTGQLATVEIGFDKTLLSTSVLPNSTLETRLSQLFTSIPKLPTTGVPFGQLLVDLASAENGEITSLLHVEVGTASSSASTMPTSLSSSSRVSAARIGILTGLGSGETPLITIAVFTSIASTSLDSSTGHLVSTDTPASVRITLNLPTGPPQSFAIAPGESKSLLTGTPLATSVSAGSGGAQNSQTGASAHARGAHVRTLGILHTSGGDGVNLLVSTTSSKGSTARSASATTPGSSTSPSSTTPPGSSTSPSNPTPAAVVGATTVHTGEFWSGVVPFVLFVVAVIGGLLLISDPKDEKRRFIRLLERFHLTRVSHRVHRSAP